VCVHAKKNNNNVSYQDLATLFLWHLWAGRSKDQRSRSSSLVM